jgi:hypothetical protein
VWDEFETDTLIFLYGLAKKSGVINSRQGEWGK